MLAPGNVRRMLAQECERMQQMRLERGDDGVGRVRILVEMNCRPGLISIRHDEGRYARYFAQIREIVGDTIRAPDLPSGEPSPAPPIPVSVEAAPELDSSQPIALGRQERIPTTVPFANASRSRIGAFEVYLVTCVGSAGVPESVGLHSKLLTRHWPRPQTIVARCQSVLAPAFRRYEAAAHDDDDEAQEAGSGTRDADGAAVAIERSDLPLGRALVARVLARAKLKELERERQMEMQRSVEDLS